MVMDFEEFWDKLIVELQTKDDFHTIERGNEFRAHIIDESGEKQISITPASGTTRGSIPKNEVEGVWNNIAWCQDEGDGRYKNKFNRLVGYVTKKGKQGKSMQISYISALIKHMVEQQGMQPSYISYLEQQGMQPSSFYDLIRHMANHLEQQGMQPSYISFLVKHIVQHPVEQQDILPDLTDITQPSTNRDKKLSHALPPGMRDFTSGYLVKIERIRDSFNELSSLYGFSLMNPSPIEMLSTLETRSGPAIRDEIYYFNDKSKRKIALRFDFTMGLTRYAASQQSMKLPAKISAFGGVFRYDEPQQGRYRYFHQWDLEVYGKPSTESDAEIIELTSRLFDKLGLQDITIDISHRRLTESFINNVFGLSDDPTIMSDILRAVDKVQKKTRDEILDEFMGKEYDRGKLGQVLDFARLKGTIAEIESHPDVTSLESWDELCRLFDSLENRGVSNARINLGIVRGLDYYSGMVFEVFGKNSELGALAGGGRYDSLTSAFGRDDIGAAGVAGGVERIVLAMDEQGLSPSYTGRAVFVVYVNDAVQKDAVRIASDLRRGGIATEIDLAGRSMKKQIEAASSGSRYAVIVGPKELESGEVVLRDMGSGKEEPVKVREIVGWLKPRLS